MKFTRATRKQVRLKLALIGPSGSGKTWSALSIAQGLGGSIAVIDSEAGSAERYAGDFEFDHAILDDFSPEGYVGALQEAHEANYDNILVDGISQEWGRLLHDVDRFGGWKEATPRHDRFVQALIKVPRNVIVTMRAKTMYDVTEAPRADGRGTKQEIVKLGLGPIQRDNVEYEFDLVGMLDLENNMKVVKSRVKPVPNGSIVEKPGLELAKTLLGWLNEGEPVAKPQEADDAAIVHLVNLLLEEGYSHEVIEGRLRQRRLEMGAITPEYVAQQTELAAKRLEAKKPQEPPADEQQTVVNETVVQVPA